MFGDKLQQLLLSIYSVLFCGGNYFTMGKEMELLQAVRDLNMPVLHKLLGKHRASKSSEFCGIFL